MKNIENNYRNSTCPFCKSSHLQKIEDLKYGGVIEFSTHTIKLKHTPELWKCSNCNSAFTQNAIPPDVAENLYATGEGSKRWTATEFVKDKTNKLIEGLQKFIIKKDAKILDIGCNTGEFLDYAKAHGNKTFGLEICAESCDILKKKGHVAYQFPREVNDTFDLITAFDVVEHLYDPSAFFASVLNMLNPKGYLAILTGNPLSRPAKFLKGKWWYYNYPEHVGFPSPEYFAKISGFKQVHQLQTYASKEHENVNLVVKYKDIVTKLINSSYAGMPVYAPDHQFVVLQKI